MIFYIYLYQSFVNQKVVSRVQEKLFTINCENKSFLKNVAQIINNVADCSFLLTEKFSYS